MSAVLEETEVKRLSQNFSTLKREDISKRIAALIAMGLSSNDLPELAPEHPPLKPLSSYNHGQLDQEKLKEVQEAEKKREEEHKLAEQVDKDVHDRAEAEAQNHSEFDIFLPPPKGMPVAHLVPLEKSKNLGDSLHEIVDLIYVRAQSYSPAPQRKVTDVALKGSRRALNKLSHNSKAETPRRVTVSEAIVDLELNPNVDAANNTAGIQININPPPLPEPVIVIETPVAPPHSASPVHASETLSSPGDSAGLQRAAWKLDDEAPSTPKPPKKITHQESTESIPLGDEPVVNVNVNDEITQKAIDDIIISLDEVLRETGFAEEEQRDNLKKQLKEKEEAEVKKSSDSTKKEKSKDHSPRKHKREKSSSSSKPKNPGKKWKKGISELRTAIGSIKEFNEATSVSPAHQSIELTMLSAALSAAVDLCDKNASNISETFDYVKFMAICASLAKYLMENVGSWREPQQIVKKADALLHVGQAFIYLMGKTTTWDKTADKVSDSWIERAQDLIAELTFKVQQRSYEVSTRVIERQRLNDLVVSLGVVSAKIMEALKSCLDDERAQGLVELLTLTKGGIVNLDHAAKQRLIEEAKSITIEAERIGSHTDAFQRKIEPNHGDLFKVQKKLAAFMHTILEYAEKLKNEILNQVINPKHIES